MTELNINWIGNEDRAPKLITMSESEWRERVETLDGYDPRDELRVVAVCLDDGKLEVWLRPNS